MNPIVAIVGRPNVGKSTLFNRLAESQIAIVEDMPGTTRDRVFADVHLAEREITLVDTGGLEYNPDTTIGKKVREQIEAAIRESDVVIFIVSVRDGLIAADNDTADMLRPLGKPVLLVANKADTPKWHTVATDFYRLGLGEPLAISAHHGRGIHELVDKLLPMLPPAEEEAEYSGKLKLAIVGRPNVGKSMLLNTLVGSERSIVDSTAGTTRDALDTIFPYNGSEVVLIDTAGIKRRGKSGIGIDYYSTVRSLRAINRCDVAIVVLDASEFMAAQDTHIAGYAKDACKGIVIAVNKWDLADDSMRGDFIEEVNKRMKFVAFAPLLFVSALTGKGVKEIIPTAVHCWEERQKKLPDTVIDSLIKEAVDAHAPPPRGTKRLAIFRAYQTDINPPSFTFQVNDPKLVHFSYERYLENRLRQTFGFSGTSLKFSFKKAAKKPRKTGGNRP